MEDYSILNDLVSIKSQPSRIMAMGVGGAGGNAIEHMWQMQIEGVNLAACNTDQDDLDKSINVIRNRPSVKMPPLKMDVARDPFLVSDKYGYTNLAKLNPVNMNLILEIRRERTIELLQEGFRYYDVIRWAEGATFETPLQGMYFPGEGTYDLNEDGTPDVTLYIGDSAPAGAAALAYKINDGLKLTEATKGCIEFHRDTRPGWKWDTVKDYYYPIPVGDRNLTGGALTQYPGWNDGLSF